MFKRTVIFSALLLMVQLVVAQVPTDYYKTTEGARGKGLKTAMFKVISGHVERSYKQLWTDFEKTDKRADGKVWDMYSSVTNFTFGKDQAGSYSVEGDVYNREHSFPKSWFNDATPMYTDLFHLYPTDGYINGMRSNYPFGETKNPSKESKGGWSKLGPSSTPGYKGTVFEPNDEYKGDFARTYFYMATAYEDKIAHWHSPMLAGNNYPAYAQWAIDMLLRWAKEDPVSEKEIKRNEAVYGIQHNRNPYIDYPGLEQYVWGNKTSVAFDPYNYDAGGEVDPNPQPGDKEVAQPVFSIASGEVEAGTEVTISSATTGAYIYYTVNGGELQTGFAPVKLTITEDAVIEAYAMVGENRSQTVKATYTIGKAPLEGSGVYVKVNSTTDLTIGYRYLIVCEGKNVAMAENRDDIRRYAEVQITGRSIKTDVSSVGLPYAFTLGGNVQGYTFYDASANTYLALTSGSKNKLYSVEKLNGTDGRWTISFTGGYAEIVSVKYPKRSIQYNASSPRFASYESKQMSVSLFKETVVDAIEFPEIVNGTVDVYTIGGRLLRDDVKKDAAVKGLPRGLYIVGGVKMLVK